MINILEKLKDVPTGFKLYTPLYGEVFLDKILDNGEIRVTNNLKQIGFYFNIYGQYHHNGECLLFPSKGIRDWNNFSIKKEEKCDFKPFDKVVVKNYNDKWRIDFFESYNPSNYMYPYICLMDSCHKCLPYNEETAKLIGTTNNYYG